MIKLKIIALGKLKEDYLKLASKEYEKRLSSYCDLEIIELTPKRLSDKPSLAEIENALLEEANMIINKIPKGSKIFAMCIEGRQITSEDFADEIKECSNNGESIVFIIGSSYGLCEKIKNLANKKMSVSKMTFPHQLFRIMLLEQIYRGFKINEGGAYHK